MSSLGRFSSKPQQMAAAFLAVTLMLSSTHSRALGIFDGEASVHWWNTQYAGSVFDGDLDVGSISMHAETWWDNSWGLRGSLYQADLDQGEGLRDEQRLSFDLKRRFISPTDNSYFAAGLGWENIQLIDNGSASGIRLSLDGQIGFAGIAAVYGRAAWLPSLSEANAYSDISGSEFETGIVFDPIPFVSIKAGYRHFELDYNFSNNTRASGLILGAGIHW